MDADDPTLASLATRFAQTNVGAMLAALAYGMATDAARPTQSSLDLFEHMAERDDGLAVVLRSHRAVNGGAVAGVGGVHRRARSATAGSTARCSRCRRGSSGRTRTASAST